jgi:hypothetical protein
MSKKLSTQVSTKAVPSRQSTDYMVKKLKPTGSLLDSQKMKCAKRRVTGQQWCYTWNFTEKNLLTASKYTGVSKTTA